MTQEECDTYNADRDREAILRNIINMFEHRNELDDLDTISGMSFAAACLTDACERRRLHLFKQQAKARATA